MAVEVADVIDTLQTADLENIETNEVDGFKIENIRISPKLAIMVPQEWIIDGNYAISFLNHIKLVDKTAIYNLRSGDNEDNSINASSDKKPYKIQDGVAYISIGNGAGMVKRPSCMSMLMGSEGSYIEYRRTIRLAAADPEVKSIALIIDTPGGESSGCFDVANDIYKINTNVKPVDAYIEDVGCSGGYLIASQCRSISCNDNANVGSIGAYTTLRVANQPEDSHIYVFTSGKYKAIGAPGQELSDEQIKYMQSRIDSLHNLFVRAVVRGRGLSADKLSKVTDASVYIGKEAKTVELVDAVESIDSFHNRVKSGKVTPRMNSVNMEELSDIQLSEPIQDEGEEILEPKVEEVTVNNPLISALTTHQITSVEQINALVAEAKFGRSQMAAIREQTAALAVVALGAEEGEDAKSIINNLPIEQVQSLAKQYIKIGKSQGLVNESGIPLVRTTGPSDNHSLNNNNNGASVETVDKNKVIQKSVEVLLNADRNAQLYTKF